MGISKRILAFVLITVMTLSLVSCEGTSWVAKLGDKTITSGAYINYLVNEYYNAIDKAQQKGLIKSDKEIFGVSLDGKDTKQWMIDNALSQARRSLVLEEMMKEMNLSISADEETAILEDLNQQWESYGQEAENWGLDKESFLACLRYNQMSLKVFNTLYGKGGTKEVPDSDLNAYFENDFYRIKMLSATLEDKKAQSTFEEYMLRIKKGQNFDDIAKEENNRVANASANETLTEAMLYVADAQIALEKAEKNLKAASAEEKEEAQDAYDTAKADYESAQKYLDDIRSSLNKENTDEKKQDLDMFGPKASNDAPDAIKTFLKEGKTNEVKVIVDGMYIYLIQILDIKEDTGYLSDELNRFGVLQAMKQEEYMKDIDDKLEKVDIMINQSAINKYDPQKLEEKTSK